MWLRALNAIGLKDSEAKNRALYEYGVAISDLDPRFKLSNEFIGLNIPFSVARNTFSGGDLACDLFRRGLKTYPTDLKLHMYLGFSLFHHERKFAEAAEVFANAAKLPDALPYMAPLAARLKAHSGAAEEALELTQQLIAEEDDEAVRAELQGRIDELQVEVALQRVDRAAKAYYERTGHVPQSLGELRVLQLYDGPDFDPLGGEISIQPDGKATSTSLARRHEIYE
jgi:tetratricopeptide (TPR) repeat protein